MTTTHSLPVRGGSVGPRTDHGRLSIVSGHRWLSRAPPKRGRGHARRFPGRLWGRRSLLSCWSGEPLGRRRVVVCISEAVSFDLLVAGHGVDLLAVDGDVEVVEGVEAVQAVRCRRRLLQLAVTGALLRN